MGQGGGQGGEMGQSSVSNKRALVPPFKALTIALIWLVTRRGVGGGVGGVGQGGGQGRGGAPESSVGGGGGVTWGGGGQGGGQGGGDGGSRELGGEVEKVDKM